MSTTPITLPPIPGPIPALPQGATHDQQMTHHAAQMRRWDAEMAVLRFAQGERGITTQARLASAQESMAGLMPDQIAALRENARLMQLFLDTPPAPAPAPAPAAPASVDGLTAGDVAIVKGIVEAVRPAAQG
jgi:hypothetical protein